MPWYHFKLKTVNSCPCDACCLLEMTPISIVIEGFFVEDKWQDGRDELVVGMMILVAVMSASVLKVQGWRHLLLFLPFASGRRWWEICRFRQPAEGELSRSAQSFPNEDIPGAR